ncbi:MAG TPA: hypothetical protein VIV11_34055 [Kofleriaceae bacterium]
MTYAPNERVQRWIAEEVKDLACVPYFAGSLREAFDALGEEVLRRVLILDYEALSKEELVELRALRKRVANGTFIVLGQVREHVRAAIRVTHVLARPLGSEALRVIVDELDRQRDTLKAIQAGASSSSR